MTSQRKYPNPFHQRKRFAFIHALGLIVTLALALTAFRLTAWATVCLPDSPADIEVRGALQKALAPVQPVFLSSADDVPRSLPQDAERSLLSSLSPEVFLAIPVILYGVFVIHSMGHRGKKRKGPRAHFS
jgi:hypothetical protein